MTNEEALKILAAYAVRGLFDCYADGTPAWSDEPEPTICLDGHFTADELRAILHFAPGKAE